VTAVTPARESAGAPTVAPAALSALRGRIEARIGALRAAVPTAVVAVAVRDLAPGGGALDLAGDSVFHAASTMKLPVMMALFRAADSTGRGLDEEIVLTNAFTSDADGSPYALDPKDDSDSAAYALVGTHVSVRELTRRMIVRSSNLATNALIARADPVRTTALARALGAARMEVRRGVEDDVAFRAGIINTTTAPDLAVLLVALERGRAASPASTRAMLDILRAQEHNAEIPAGLPPGTVVAHKTGSITGVLHDAALVYPTGRALRARRPDARDPRGDHRARGDRRRGAPHARGARPYSYGQRGSVTTARIVSTAHRVNPGGARCTQVMRAPSSDAIARQLRSPRSSARCRAARRRATRPRRSATRAPRRGPRPRRGRSASRDQGSGRPVSGSCRAMRGSAPVAWANAAALGAPARHDAARSSARPAARRARRALPPRERDRAGTRTQDLTIKSRLL
jgi:beta-lactamase class A